MKIIVGSYKLKTVTNFLCKLEGLLPVCNFVHKEFVPSVGLREVKADIELDYDQQPDRLLSELSEKNITCALYPAASLPAHLPEGIDKFSLPEFREKNDPSVLPDDLLTLLFHRNDEIIPVIRNLFLPPVVFAGAGIGGIDNVTLGVINALKVCDVCVYDALIPDGIIDFLPAAAEKIFVGKRSGHHYMKQDEINRLLVELGKSGKKVVRLKGGDPSVFGRLAEEVDSLQQERLPFRVLPGITTLNVAAAASGLLPSRRGINRGFTISTPRRAGRQDFAPLSVPEQKESFNVYYMAANLVPEIVATMLCDNFPSDWPISLVYDAGSWDEAVVCGTLSDIVEKVSRPEFKRRPALVLTGKGAADSYLFQTCAPLAKRKIIYCGSEHKDFNICKSASENFGGKAIFVDSVTIRNDDSDILKLEYDAIIFLDEESRQIFYDKLGIAALTGKMVVTLSAEIDHPSEGLTAAISAPEITGAVFRLAGYFSNCKIEMMHDNYLKMEICNGR